MSKLISTFRLLLTAALVVPLASPMLAPSALAQTARSLNVKGTVCDAEGEPLAGATVNLKNTPTAVATDIDGKFTIAAPKGAKLVVNYVGFEPATVVVPASGTLDVVLTSKDVSLDEVVAIGYGSVARKDITGSLSTVSAKDLMRANPTSINQGLQGKVAGVQVLQADGAPGAGISIQIRGTNSFSGNTEPLYVIDGVPMAAEQAPTEYGQKSSNNPLASISPSDIESMQILKDASATAIYGSRAANGVVIITTKSGQKGRPKVTFSANLSISKVIKKIDVLPAGDYARFKNECRINGYLYDGKDYVADSELPYPSPGYWYERKEINPETGQEEIVSRTYNASPEDYDNGYIDENGNFFRGTNWQDEIFRTAVSQEYTLGVSGGDDKGNYMFSGSFLDQQGTIVNSYFKRYSIRSNNTRYINKWLTLGCNLAFSTSKNRLARTNWETSSLITSAISFNPCRPVFDPTSDSHYSEDFASGMYNPYLTSRTEKNILDNYNVSASGNAEVKFTDWLKLHENVGYYWDFDRRGQYYNRYTGTGQAPTNGSARRDESTYHSVTVETTLNFDRTFGLNKINAVLGMTYENYGGNRLWMTAKNFPNDLLEDNDMSAAVGDKEIGTSKWKAQLWSFLGRVNYGFDNRYLVTFSYRRDGSSRFAPQNHWSNFYSGALAWRLSEEKFIKKLNFFNNLKLRVSAGQTGSQAVSTYATRSRFEVANYPFGGAMSPGFAEDRWGGPAAPNLKWETTDQYDLGLDVSILNYRVGFTIDAYYKKTRDLLQSRYIDQSSGFNTIACNFGNVVNKGLEIEAHFIPIQSGDWRWSIDGNISFNRNRIGGLDADQFSDVA